MKTILFLLILVGICKLAPCQSNKEIRFNKIKSVTTWQSEKGAGQSDVVKESYEVFDKDGNTTLKIKYKKDGTVDTKETTKYDKNQNKIEEFQYTGSDEIVSHKAYVYNAFGKKTEEREYTPTGEPSKETVFTYNPSGEKNAEIVTDSKGNLLKKVEYSYNAKNLKTQRTTSNKTKQVESVKKWSYEYY